MSTLSSLPPADLKQISGGGIIDDLGAWFEEFLEDFTRGSYHASGCDGRH